MILIVACITFIIAITFFLGIAPTFIKSLSTMSEEEKNTLYLERLYCNVGVMILILSLILFIVGCNPSLPKQALRVATFAWIILCIIDIMVIEKSKYFIRKE